MNILQPKIRLNRFFEKHKMLSLEQVLKLSAHRDSNNQSSIPKLVDTSQIIEIKQGAKNVFPAFQFNELGEVYMQIIMALPFVIKNEIPILDFCYWLTDKCTVLLSTPINTENYVGWTFEKVIEHGNELQKQSVTFDGRPIEALQKGDSNTFKQLLSEWLSPYDYDVYNVEQ